MKVKYLIFIIIFLTLVHTFYYNHVEYYQQILKYRKIPDFTRWILSDKYVAKEYARINGFDVPKTFQLVKYPHQIDFENLPQNFVIKPTDLYSSEGIYLIKNGYDLLNKKVFNSQEMIKKLNNTRSTIGNEYYMHDLMYNGLVPYSGIIVEELLLDDKGNLPYDYKCYTFGGKIYYIAVTFNRRFINNSQKFDVVWFDRNWNPIKTKMLKENYHVKNIPKPKAFNKMVYLVERISKKFNRHCRIDVYCINDKVYLGEFTFFCGARLHTFKCNFLLGMIWLKNPDCYLKTDPKLLDLIPEYYNKV